MEDLAELNPTFLRLPGGNMLEGNTQTNWWKWNETIGPLKDRPGMANVWNYQITYGLGLVEYMEWCEDLNIEPIVAVWDGLSLDGHFTSEADFQPIIQFALDEIEFLTGDVSTKWGAVRASIGHPTPWKVKYVEIGNEDWLAGAPAGYDSFKAYRLPLLIKAFTEKYPDIKLISSSSVFDNITIPAPAAGDFHAYLTPDGNVASFSQFDHLTKDNLTLIGEYATVHPNGGTAWEGNLMPYPWWGGSVSEAIFLLGAERNGDRVIGATYAPGLRNLNRWQWSVTLMQHSADPKQTTRSTSWYMLRVCLPPSFPHCSCHRRLTESCTALRLQDHHSHPPRNLRRQFRTALLRRRKQRRRPRHLQSRRIQLYRGHPCLAPVRGLCEGCHGAVDRPDGTRGSIRLQ